METLTRETPRKYTRARTTTVPEGVESFNTAFDLVYQPQLRKDRIDDVDVGRLTLPVKPFSSWHPNETIAHLMSALNGVSPESAERRSSMRSLHDNTPNTRFRDPSVHFGHGVSAYVTYKPAEVSDETDAEVILEWGKIGGKGNRKLHEFLNRACNIGERKDQGMQVTSGHMAQLIDKGEYLVLMDRLAFGQQHISCNSPMGEVINTLYMNGFIPLTSDGYVQLPAF